MLTISGPYSSYSAFVIHMDWNVDSDAIIDPSTYEESFLSGGSTTFISMRSGIKVANSFCRRFANPTRHWISVN